MIYWGSLNGKKLLNSFNKSLSLELSLKSILLKETFFSKVILKINRTLPSIKNCSISNKFNVKNGYFSSTLPKIKPNRVQSNRSLGLNQKLSVILIHFLTHTSFWWLLSIIWLYRLSVYFCRSFQRSIETVISVGHFRRSFWTVIFNQCHKQ